MKAPITPQLWERIKDVFEAALEREPAERSSLVAEACGGDVAMRAEVERLLMEYERAGSFIEKPVVDFFGARRFSPGETLCSRYRIVRFLGQGGMGVVYEAEDLELGEKVALKTLLPAMALEDSIVARFKQEIQLARKVTHPNVCRIFDFGTDAGIAFLTMELLQGETLSTRLKRSGRLSTEEALPLVEQLGAALSAAHTAGIVHRDFKCANIMLVPSQSGSTRAVVTDFGLAHLLIHAEEGATITISGKIMGTPAYMAPEQLLGGRVNEAADLYALGVVLFEMLTGNRPFKADTPVSKRVPPSPREQVPHLDPKWEKAILKCLALDAEDRFTSADAVVESIRDGDHRLQTRWRIAAGALVFFALLCSAALVPAIHERATDWITAQGLPAEKNLVVLPFENIGNDPANQPFCDGLFEIVTDNLAQLIPSDSRMQIVPISEVRKQSVKSAQDAHKLFGANLVVTAAIQHNHDALRISAKLVDASTLKQVREQTLDHRPQDRLSAQEALASRIADMLRVNRRADYTHARPAPGSLDANNLYLNGVGNLPRSGFAGNLDKAIESLQRSAQKDPGYGPVKVALSGAYLQRFTETKKQEWLDAAHVQANLALATTVNFARAHVALGRSIAAAGDPQEAIAEFEKALSLEPGNIDTTRELAKADESLGRLAEAEATYKRAVALRQDDWLSFTDLGVFYWNLHRYADAASIFERVVKMTPGNPTTHRNLGGVYTALGRYPDAERELRESLLLQPTAAAYSSLGTIYIYQHRYREAVPVMEKAADLISSGNRNSYLVWSNLGDAYRYTPEFKGKSSGAYQHAIEELEKQLRREPNNVELLSRMAVYLAKSERSERAAEVIERALRLAPTNAGVLFRSAVVFNIGSRKERALSALDEAVRGGFPVDEIRREPELDSLGADRRFQGLLNASQFGGKR